MSEPFDWRSTDTVDDIVIRTVQGVAVYLNPRNDIVIRQERDSTEEEDTVIIVPADCAERLARKILAVAEEAKQDA
ncbi:hypothetical protein [Azospirillum sp. ST 5-10]|uniref:hypothetical protein n=1 Tax=unclassified Azospirillum TaxID=2630922 RepID=UPI003F4A1E39